MLARLFPEIAKSQDNFEHYSGRQVGVHRAQRELLDAALSDLASSEGVLTPRATDLTKAIAELHPGATPEDAPEMARVVATKSGWIRGFFSTVTKLALDQFGNLRENIRSKGLYDFSKEVVKILTDRGFGGTLTLIGTMTRTLSSLAAQWPAMFDFVKLLLRLLVSDGRAANKLR